MKYFDLNKQALASETACVEFLQSYGLFDDSKAICPGKASLTCQLPMGKFYKKNAEGEVVPAWRCTKKACRKQVTMRKTNKLFSGEVATGKPKTNLSLRQIVLLMYQFAGSNDTMAQVMEKTGHNEHTILRWFNAFRDVCSAVIEEWPKTNGTDDKPVQIDESYFQGRRKYNRGRILDGNKRTKGWVFGLYMSPKRYRFYVVNDRSGDTLSPLIHANVTPGSTVVSDEWRAYNRLTAEGIKHETVNHSKNFVNPETGFHTQSIERAWKEGKAWLQRARHPGNYLQKHLDEVSWRAYRRDHPEGLFGALIEDVHKHFNKEIV